MPARRKPSMPPLDDLLTTREAAAAVKRHTRWLHRKAADGLLTKYYLGSRVYWSRRELAALVSTTAPEWTVAGGQRLADFNASGGDAA